MNIKYINKNMKIVFVQFIVHIMRWILSVFHFLLFGMPSCNLNNNPKRILLFRSSALGDFIFSVPSMVALRKRFPSAKIKLLTISTSQYEVRKQVQDYVGSSHSLPWVSFVVPSIVDNAICMNTLKITDLNANIVPLIKQFDPDMTVILPQQFGGGFLGTIKKLFFLRFLGVHGPVFGWRMRNTKFFKHAQYEACMLDHGVIAPLRAICEIPPAQPIENIDIKFPLYVEPDAENWAEQLWDEKKWHNKIVVAVAPGSVQPHKRWPIERFEELCRKLTAGYPISFVVVGTVGDIPLGERIVSSVTSAGFNLAGKTSVMKAAAVFRRCSMLVGNDGGAVHLASAMGCPSVSIIPGLEYPGSVEPWPDRDLSVRHPVSCAPCYSMKSCPKVHNRCMTELPMEHVFEKCAEVLDQRITCMN